MYYDTTLYTHFERDGVDLREGAPSSPVRSPLDRGGPPGGRLRRHGTPGGAPVVVAPVEAPILFIGQCVMWSEVDF